jgi:hypothetical protein
MWGWGGGRLEAGRGRAMGLMVRPYCPEIIIKIGQFPSSYTANAFSIMYLNT